MPNPSFVQSASNTQNSGTSLAVTISTTAGNTIIVGIAWGTTPSDATISSVADTGGSSYSPTIAKQQVGSGGFNVNIAMYTCLSCLASSSVTVTSGSSLNGFAFVAECSNVGSIGQTVLDPNTGGGNSPEVTVTPVQANSLIVAASGLCATDGGYTANFGTIREQQLSGGGGSYGKGTLMTNTEATTAPLLTKWTSSAGSGSVWYMVAVELPPFTGIPISARENYQYTIIGST